MGFAIVFDREEDGRWIAEAPALPGALAYEASKDEALEKASALVDAVSKEVPHRTRTRDSEGRRPGETASLRVS